MLGLNASNSSRQTVLKAWLVLNGYSMCDLAKKMEVHPSMITRIIKSEHAPAKRIQQLAQLGVPQELLPKPSRTPGRPRKVESQSATNL